MTTKSLVVENLKQSLFLFFLGFICVSGKFVIISENHFKKIQKIIKNHKKTQKVMISLGKNANIFFEHARSTTSHIFFTKMLHYILLWINF